MSWRVAALCAGQAAPIGNGTKASGILKTAIEGPVRIGMRGIETDEQVDRKYHGYPAMALHHFPHDHYPWLRDLFASPAPLAGRGGIGENISTDGLIEDAVLIGDRFRLGTALIEVTQPRQPCATIEHHLQRKGVVKAMVAEARSGWFYRVIEPGIAKAGQLLTKVEDGHSGWSVSRAFRAVYGKDKGSPAELTELDRLSRVSDRLRRDIAKRLAAR